jgi:hypothetical protein
MSAIASSVAQGMMGRYYAASKTNSLSELVGLVLYERKALRALMLCGVADAATLCREGSVPTSKIYLAMEEKLAPGLLVCQSARRHGDSASLDPRYNAAWPKNLPNRWCESRLKT